METVTTDPARFSRDENVVMRRIAGEALLIPVRKRLADLDCVYVLHGVGEFLWERLGASRTKAELVRDVVENFVVAEGEATTDVDAFLGELTKAGLARIAKVS